VLTDEGRERLEEAGRSHVAQVRELIEQQLAPEEVETLVELLGRLPGGAAGSGEACSP
jgi:DNA-binding MarR family transcriptional regulator